MELPPLDGLPLFTGMEGSLAERRAECSSRPIAVGSGLTIWRAMNTGTNTGTDLIPIDPERMAHDERVVNDGFWAKLRANIGKVPFVEDAVAAFYCATDPLTPLRAKAVLLGALAYFIMPADAVPDFIALLGFTDDAAVMMAALQTVRTHLRPDHYERARATIATVARSPGEEAARDRAAG